MRKERLDDEISIVDHAILGLVRKRLELTLCAERLNGREDGGRSREPFFAGAKGCEDIYRPELIQSIGEALRSEYGSLAERGRALIGFQGEHGAYSEVASRVHDPLDIPVPYREYGRIFEDVESGVIDLGIVPLENSVEGAVTEVNDLLLLHDVSIVGEITIPIHHCLLVLPRTDYREIKVVYSHPQALAQCRGFISRHKLESRPCYDTAGSAKILAETRPQAACAIASRLCGELYNLDILRENIEDGEGNHTRFVIIGREARNEGGNKCSVAVTLSADIGSLAQVLRGFSDNGIRLTRVDSRPLHDEPGGYVFFVDFLASREDEALKRAMGEMEKSLRSVKFLGCYLEGRSGG